MIVASGDDGSGVEYVTSQCSNHSGHLGLKIDGEGMGWGMADSVIDCCTLVHPRSWLAIAHQTHPPACEAPLLTSCIVCQSAVLGSWVGVRRILQLSLLLTASRVVLPKILVLMHRLRTCRTRQPQVGALSKSKARPEATAQSSRP